MVEILRSKDQTGPLWWRFSSAIVALYSLAVTSCDTYTLLNRLISSEHTELRHNEVLSIHCNDGDLQSPAVSMTDLRWINLHWDTTGLLTVPMKLIKLPTKVESLMQKGQNDL